MCTKSFLCTHHLPAAVASVAEPQRRRPRHRHDRIDLIAVGPPAQHRDRREDGFCYLPLDHCSRGLEAENDKIMGYM